MTFISFENFADQPKERAAVERIFKGLQRAEIGRRFQASLPPRVTFRYLKGDRFSRASASVVLDRITVYQNTFQSDFATVQTVLHELAHLLQSVPSLDPSIKGLLEGAHNLLAKHQKDPRFGWVAEPLKRVKTEEIYAQDMVGLILMLGYNRPYRDHYYIPGDEAAPPRGALRPTLSAQGRREFDSLKGQMQARALSPQELQANFQAYEEFYERAQKAGWTSADKTFEARLAKERLMRSGRPSAR